MNFDITTNTVRQIKEHSLRPYKPELILYERPTNFVMLP